MSYNHHRPLSGINWQTPAAYSASLSQQADGMFPPLWMLALWPDSVLPSSPAASQQIDSLTMTGTKIGRGSAIVIIDCKIKRNAMLCQAVSSKKNASSRTRTLNPLIKSQQAEFTNNYGSCICNPSCFEVTPNATTLQHPNIDADLQQLIQAWPTLPPMLKARIAGMVDAASMMLKR